jgi:hypothetical protein
MVSPEFWRSEQNEIWSTGREYFDMEEYFEWKAAQPQMAGCAK